jgi:pyruvate/2-oxoglutarate dehydrogenase complex dihydrolipoamide acyltransferase (E2) component
MQNIQSPLQAQVVQWLVQPGMSLAAGDVLVILEAMKMEHEIRAPHDGRLNALYFQAGETVNEGEALASWAQMDSAPVQSDSLAQAQATLAVPSTLDASPPAQAQAQGAASAAAQSAPRADLKKLQDRLAYTQDAARPEAVAKRHALAACRT